MVIRPSLLSELKRRNVLRAAALYVGTVWLLAQVVTQLGPVFDTPAWVARWFLAGSAVGFPFWIALAWFYELTPDGLKRESDVAPGDSIRQLTGRRLDRAIIAVLAVAVVLLLTNTFMWHRGGAASDQDPAPAASERSIAVLPLVNASNDPGQQFFSDGLSENLIDSLSRFGGLKVIGRISAFQFRDSKDNSATIGRKLGVAYLLNGSVQRAADIVRISVSLTRAADGSTLWAEHYDRPYKDLFALQDEITQAVAGALRVKLLSPNGAAKQSDRPPSGSIDAYNAYLHGLKYWHEEKFLDAAEYMATAVQLDPGYALAWAQLSGSLSTAGTFYNQPPAVAREQMRKARLAADKALQLAPGMGAAHAARAYLHVYGFDHRGALAGCRRAVQLAPEDGTVLNGCGYVFAQVGKLGEAIQLRKRLLSTEPLYIINYQQYARLLMATGRLDEAEKYLRTAESLPQTNPDWHFAMVFFQMTAALMRGEADAAMKFAVQIPTKYPDLYAALAAQIGSDRAAADAALANVLASKAEANADPYRIAQIYALRGDAGHAVEWLKRASIGDLLFLPTDPYILSLRGDPRFIAFCKKVGLPPPSEIETLGMDQIRAL
ncbi:MAG TPA: tetratricopeptide repeat protein [Rhodanobacteraceae bacterium]|nr:tetratricopeptide repeat protein [Rhodanobacteraceae bacterium]